MFDVKDTDFFDLEDESFDTIVEDDIAFTGSIKIKKTFLIRGKVNGTIDSASDLVIDTEDGRDVTSSNGTWNTCEAVIL